MLIYDPMTLKMLDGDAVGHAEEAAVLLPSMGSSICKKNTLYLYPTRSAKIREEQSYL
jgi:hypothetical protein